MRPQAPAGTVAHKGRRRPMTIAKTLAAVATIAALTAIPAAAQQAVPPYGAPISLEQAKKVIAAAEAEAQKNSWPVAITVVDSGGFLVAMHRLDNTQLGSIAVAEDKARTSVLFRRPSKGLRGRGRRRRHRLAHARPARRHALRGRRADLRRRQAHRRHRRLGSHAAAGRADRERRGERVEVRARP